ncbi:dihydrofolate reductase family protein [Micromonospora sp. NPDC047670]|uniref:dihydrofolate reductase family protein n=1 Tax=Micromonospora sp. NPDC047670 TaxID=3364252 RepID=UPI0037191932
MRKLTYYIAATLDGFIAGPDGQFDFFPIDPDLAAAMNAEQPETVPTRFRSLAGLADAENRRFDTVLMGRGTYEPEYKKGITSPYAHLRQYVFAHTDTAWDPQVEVVDGDPVAFVRRLKQQPGKDIWLCGGGRLAGQLSIEIDELTIKRYPLVIGAGIPLFAGPFTPTGFALAETRTFASGATVTTYTRT